MKRSAAWVFSIVGFIHSAKAQTNSAKAYRNFPIVLSIQFHSLSFPLKDLESNFKNVGFGIGSEIALGSNHNWAQQFQCSWYQNRQGGNWYPYLYPICLAAHYCIALIYPIT